MITNLILMSILSPIGDVPTSAADAKPLIKGATAPSATIRTLEGKETTLNSVMQKKPTVVIFYRGGWCPYCNLHLKELAKIESKIVAKGYQLIALSPDQPEQLNQTAEKGKLAYQLFSDSNAEAMKNFGVAYRVDDGTYIRYRDGFRVDLEKYSGAKHHILPVPSVFVIAPNGKIKFAYANADYKVRLKSEDLLRAL